MLLHVVITTVGGYVRDGQGTPTVIGIYTDTEVARVVCQCCGSRASVKPIQVDAIPIGVREYAKKLKIKLPG